MVDSAEKKEKKAGFASKWKGLKAEFQKIVWPDKEATFKQSVVVVVIAVVVGVIIALLDYVIKNGVNFITSF